MSTQMKRSMTYLVVSFGVIMMVLIAGCGSASTPQPVSTTPPMETATIETPTPVGTDTEPAPETAQPTADPMDVPSATVVPTDTQEGPETEEPVVKTPAEEQQMPKNEVVAAVKADLASRLEISQGQITVVSAKAVTWNDASLGCPQPGEMYAQVLTPGYQIILEAQDTQYDYHTDDLGHFVLCEK